MELTMRSANSSLVPLISWIAVGVLLSATPTAEAASCSNRLDSFRTWLSQFKIELRAESISGRNINRAFDGITYDLKVSHLDRGQRSFKQSLERFYMRRVSPSLPNKAHGKFIRHAPLLSRIDQWHGVPPEIMFTIWGMARTFGQQQFLASSIVKHAVDFDGNGRCDLIRSISGVPVSTANFLNRQGWRHGKLWGPGTHNFVFLKQPNHASVDQRTSVNRAAVPAAHG